MTAALYPISGWPTQSYESSAPGFSSYQVDNSFHRDPPAVTKVTRVPGKTYSLPGRIENPLNCSSYRTGLATPALYSALTRVYTIS